MIECRRNAPFCLPSPGVASRLYASPGPLQPVKQPSDSHPPKISLLGRLTNGLKRLLGDSSAGTSTAASPPPPARSKKDLFPDEKFEPGEGSGRESRDGAARGGRGRTGRAPGGDERPAGAGAGGGRSADGRGAIPGAAEARPPREPRPPREGPPREPRPPREGPLREPREPRAPREGGGPRDQRSADGGDRFVRAERSGRADDRGPRPERSGRGGRSGGRDSRDARPPRDRDPEEGRGPRQPLPPAGPPPEPPAEPVGPFPEAFEALGLSPRVLGGIRDMGYSTPTTIQEKGIPLALEGRDMIGASQTGTGKTAAFGLPILSKLGAPQNAPRVLILEPTRELAAQVVEAFDKFNVYTGLRTVAVYGGVGYDKQRRALHEGIDVIVATPGRLLDFIGDGTISLASLQYLVLDEVDRMLDMGFLPDVRRIVDHCPDQRQTAFFSATMPAQIKTLANWALKTPAEVEVGIRFSPAETVSHYFYPVAADQREQLLKALLEKTDWQSIMIFTRTKMQADRIYGTLSTSTTHKVAVMHSDIAQRDREKALAGFRDGSFEVIVATDLAARGLDISGVSHVINYQVPENPEDYVHRIGRTGRAKKEGDAYTLLSADELECAESIERLIGQTIERRQLEGFDYEYTALLDPHAGSAEKFKKLFRSAKPTGKKRR